jgi:ABC-type spermidine/putrescine transport system permease subunit II
MPELASFRVGAQRALVTTLLLILACLSLVRRRLSVLESFLSPGAPHRIELYPGQGEEIETFSRVIIPHMIPGILSAILLTFAHAAGEFSLGDMR